MPRLRSVLVVALIWMAAFAASSVPAGLGGAARAGARSPVEAPAGGSIDGKRWAVVASLVGPWDTTDSADGKRWD